MTRRLLRLQIYLTYQNGFGADLVIFDDYNAVFISALSLKGYFAEDSSLCSLGEKIHVKTCLPSDFNYGSNMRRH